jgi:hypothetical protein
VAIWLRAWLSSTSSASSRRPVRFPVASELQHGAVDLAHLAHGIAHHQHIGHGGQYAFGKVMGFGQLAVLGFQCFLRGHQFAIHLVHALDHVYPGGFGQLLACSGNTVVRQADWRIQGVVVGWHG